MRAQDVKVIGCGIIDVGGEDGKCMVTRLEIRVRDCRRRIVSRVLEACDVKVLRLCRRTFGPVLLGNLKRGDSRKMTAKEIRALKRGVGRGR